MILRTDALSAVLAGQKRAEKMLAGPERRTTDDGGMISFEF